jgi:hypothetical protein
LSEPPAPPPEGSPAGPPPRPASDTVGTGSAVALACSLLTVAAIALGIAAAVVIRLV